MRWRRSQWSDGGSEGSRGGCGGGEGAGSNVGGVTGGEIPDGDDGAVATEMARVPVAMMVVMWW